MGTMTTIFFSDGDWKDYGEDGEEKGEEGYDGDYEPHCEDPEFNVCDDTASYDIQYNPVITVLLA